jgi:DUF1680 family protein
MRMLRIKLKAEYADLMERALYNGVLSGMSQDGKRFFYVNPLEVNPEECKRRDDHSHVKPTRQKWFACACCPPNVARLLASIGQYMYSFKDNTIYLNLYNSSSAKFNVNGENVTVTQETDYPWDGRVQVDITCDRPVRFTLAVRLPGSRIRQ